MQRANRIRNGDPLPFQFVPDIRAHGVVNFVNASVIAHVELDLVDHRVVGEIDEENFHWRSGQNPTRIRRGATESIFHPVRRHVVIEANADPHRMDLGRIMEVDDRALDDLVVWNVEINGVVGAQARGTPVNLSNFTVGLPDFQPVSHLVGPIELDRHSRDDPGEEILASETKNDRNHA